MANVDLQSRGGFVGGGVGDQYTFKTVGQGDVAVGTVGVAGGLMDF